MKCDSIVFEVAETVIAVRFDWAIKSPDVPPVLQPFLSDSEPEFTVFMRNSGLPSISLLEEDKLFETEGHWAMYRTGEKRVLVTAPQGDEQAPSHMAVIHEGFGSAEIFSRTPNYWQTEGILSEDPIGFPLSQLLIVWLMAQGRGLMVHACGIKDGDKGYLFAGNSGHGKTTMAKLWRRHGMVLNDDRIILRPKDGRYRMYGTPWHGLYTRVSSESVPLEKIFFLGRSETNSAVPVTKTAAGAKLLSRSFPPLWDKDGMLSTLDLVHGLTTKVPCFDFGFIHDRSVVEFARCVK